eukprot:scaffold54396_cov45-Attheya_sp.AAC.1
MVRFSLETPDTLLRPTEEENFQDEEASERRVSLLKERSVRMGAGQFSKARKATILIRQELEAPGVSILEKGFPGQLSQKEVDQVQVFRRELEVRDHVYKQIVHQYVDIGVEEEAYALCRFLRARKYEPEKVFELLDEGKEGWREAQALNFFPDPEESMGVSLSLFLKQYPYVFHGNAKNGCPVSYLQAGHLDAEDGRTKNPNFRRCEAVNVLDLKGLTRSQINSDSLDVFKVVGQITKSFPETMHCCVIVNAPSFFTIAWKLIKKFIDARTSSKIEIYSSTKEGKKRLLELIDGKSVPSDYGGSAPSMSSLISKNQTCGDDAASWHISKLMHVHSGKKKAKFECEIPAGGPPVSFQVHTRCASGATFSFFKDSELLKEVVVTNSTNDVGAYSKEVITELDGPGKFRVEAKALAKAGYFMLVGN